MISIILPLLLIGQAQAYSNGAPTSACGDMVPQHGGSDQTGPLPVTWTIANNCYQTNQPIIVAFTSTGFEGLLLRLVYNVEGFENAAGNFVTDNTNGNYQLIACGGQQSSGLTHMTSSQKTSFSYNFQPKTGISSPFTIYLTLVVSKSVYWVKKAYTLPECSTVTTGPITFKSTPQFYSAGTTTLFVTQPQTTVQSVPTQTQTYTALVTSTTSMRMRTPAAMTSLTGQVGTNSMRMNVDSSTTKAVVVTNKLTSTPATISSVKRDSTSVITGSFETTSSAGRLVNSIWKNEIHKLVLFFILALFYYY